MIKACFNVIESLSLPNGLHRASSSDDYGYVWLRDSVYIVLPYVGRSCGTVERVVHRWLDTFRDLEEVKLNHHTKQRPIEWWQYIHARYSMDGVKEMPGEWGHAQHDSIGAFLWLVGEAHKRGHKVLRDDKDREIIQKLVDYLVTLEYWHDPDNGMWEEYREVHASSVGACLAGIAKVWEIVTVPWHAVSNGIGSLMNLGSRESETKDIDLAQLSLIYPYDIVPEFIAREIVQKVEEKLLRSRGVARYVGDSYYSTLEAEHGRGQSRSFYEGTEAEWTFGLPWLALCHLKLGNKEKAREYIERTEAVMVEPGVLPELYYANSDHFNVNSPLGWSSSMYILAKEAYLHSGLLEVANERD